MNYTDESRHSFLPVWYMYTSQGCLEVNTFHDERESKEGSLFAVLWYFAIFMSESQKF
jgi:hypothetical protein